MAIFLIVGVRLHHMHTLKGRKHLEEKFNERYNAFSRQIQAPLKIFRQGSVDSRSVALDEDVKGAMRMLCDDTGHGAKSDDNLTVDTEGLESEMDTSVDTEMGFDINVNVNVNGSFDTGGWESDDDGNDNNPELPGQNLDKYQRSMVRLGLFDGAGGQIRGSEIVGIPENNSLEMGGRIEGGSSGGNSSYRGSIGAAAAPQGREMKIDIGFKNMSVILANKQVSERSESSEP